MVSQASLIKTGLAVKKEPTKFVKFFTKKNEEWLDLLNHNCGKLLDPAVKGNDVILANYYYRITKFRTISIEKTATH